MNLYQSLHSIFGIIISNWHYLYQLSYEIGLK